MRTGRRAAAVFVVLCAWGAAETRAQDGESFAVFPSAGNQIQIYRGEECCLELLLHGWGTGFQPYLGFRGEAKADGPVLQQRTEVAIRASGTRQLTWHAGATATDGCFTMDTPGTNRLLDHDGARTEKTLPVADGAFTIDGARDKTCYHLVEY
jgi:hypothetical protein